VIGMAAEQPSFEYVCGAAANAGLANFTRAMGKGSREHGVRVVAVHPPATRTDRIITLMKAQAKAGHARPAEARGARRSAISLRDPTGRSRHRPVCWRASGVTTWSRRNGAS